MNKNYIFHDNGKILEIKIKVLLSNGTNTTYSVFYDLVNNIKLDSAPPTDVRQPYFNPDRSCCISPPELPSWCQIYVSATENLVYLYQAVLANYAFYTELDSFIINGVEQISSPIGIQISPDNAEIIEIDSQYGINNITTVLNTLSPNFFFEVVGINDENAWYMTVTYPYDYEWSINLTGTRVDPSPAPYTYDNIDGVVLTNEGLDCVYYFGLGGCGPVYESGSPARYLNPLNKTCY